MSVIDENLVESRRLIRKANFHLNHENYSDAKSLYEKALKLTPDSNDLLITLAKLESQENQEKSIRYLRDALEIDDTVEVRIELAYLLFQDEQYEETLDLVKDIDTLDTEVIKLISRIKLNKNLQNINLMTTPATSIDYVQPFLGELYHKLGNHAKALTYFRKVGSTWKSLHARGVQEYILGSLRNANEHLTQAYNQYTRQKERDSKIENKLFIDMILTIQNPEERLDKLIEISEEYENWRIYQGIIVSYTEIIEFDGDIDQIKNFLELAIETCDDELEKEEMETWRRIFE